MTRKKGIGTISEWSLHSDLKKTYLTPDSKEEVQVEGYVVDVVRDGLLIEIQTGNFPSIRDKLAKLVRNNQVRLAYPIAVRKWIVRQSPDGTEILSRRKSPRQLGPQSLFDELVYLPTLLHHQNFSLEVLLIEEEEIRRRDYKGSWRRKGWSIVDRRLLSVVGKRLYQSPEELLHFIPETIQGPFTNSDLVEATGYSKREAAKITYALRKMRLLRTIGKKGNSNVFERQRSP